MELPQNTIKNPLTIIGIFAAISEISGTTVLAFLTEDIQKIFVWYVIFFPVLLVVLFFTVILTKHQALYAPSDFKTDEAFSGLIKNVQSQSSLESKNKKRSEIEEIHEDSLISAKTVAEEKVVYNTLNSTKIDYFIAEELAIKKLSEEYGERFLQEKTFELGGKKYSVDGLINTPPKLSVFEIKYFPQIDTPSNGIARTYNYFKEIYERIDRSKYNTVVFNIIVVTPVSQPERDELQKKLEYFKQKGDLRININIYDFNTLKQEYGIG